jgi:hypothetical protein
VLRYQIKNTFSDGDAQAHAPVEYPLVVLEERCKLLHLCSRYGITRCHIVLFSPEIKALTDDWSKQWQTFISPHSIPAWLLR